MMTAGVTLNLYMYKGELLSRIKPFNYKLLHCHYRSMIKSMEKRAMAMNVVSPATMGIKPRPATQKSCCIKIHCKTYLPVPDEYTYNQWI